MTAFALRRLPQVMAGGLCLGLAAANAVRAQTGLVLVLSAVTGSLALVVDEPRRLGLLALSLALCGWWWASARLDSIDRSPLRSELETAARARVIVTGPARRGRYDLRLPALAVRYGDLVVREPVLLRLPLGRAPPEGAVLDTVAQVTEPRGPRNGFDERTWLRRHGVHVVLRAHYWRQVGWRRGLGGVADALRRRLRDSVARGLSGSRAAVVEGIVLGEDSGLSKDLRQRFRAAGLYHLLAVSGQNVALVAGSALGLAWLVGIPRLVAELGALAAIVGYVLAVGAQPSVVRAGIAGALGSLAWLTARATDRWYLLLLGAIVLLAWNPYTLFDAGFQLSFAAVSSIFLLVPRFDRVLLGYPLGKSLRLVVAVSAACGVATAPIGWLQFHSLQLLTVPANALAAPVAAPLLGLALGAAAVTPLSPSAAAALAWLNGWCAAYLVLVARVIGGLPIAQVTSTRSLLFLLAGVFLLAAYALPSKWRSSGW